LSPCLQQRLQKLLRDEDTDCRADVPDSLVQVGNEVGDFFARKRFGRHHRAVLVELLGGLLHHDLLDAHRTEDFHGALMNQGRARMNCCAAMVLYRECANSVMGQQQRGGHSHQAAADNKDRGLDVVRGHFET